MTVSGDSVEFVHVGFVAAAAAAAVAVAAVVAAVVAVGVGVDVAAVAAVDVAAVAVACFERTSPYSGCSGCSGCSGYSGCSGWFGLSGPESRQFPSYQFLHCLHWKPKQQRFGPNWLHYESPGANVSPSA